MYHTHRESTYTYVSVDLFTWRRHPFFAAHIFHVPNESRVEEPHTLHLVKRREMARVDLVAPVEDSGLQ